MAWHAATVCFMPPFGPTRPRLRCHCWAGTCRQTTKLHFFAVLQLTKHRNLVNSFIFHPVNHSTPSSSSTWTTQSLPDAPSATRRVVLSNALSARTRCTAARSVKQTICKSARSIRHNSSVWGIDSYGSALHRNSCSFKERNLKLQTCCAVCQADFGATSPTCNLCHGIKYCSEKCKADNV